MKLTILAAAAAITMIPALAQSEAAKPIKPPVAASIPVKTAPPAINTSKLWRLVAQATSLRQQALATPQAKAADAAEEEIKKEQELLAKACGADFTLGYQQDTKAENAGDVICIPKPPDAKAAPDKGK